MTTGTGAPNTGVSNTGALAAEKPNTEKPKSASRAAQVAGRGEITVPVQGEMKVYPNRQEEFDAFRLGLRAPFEPPNALAALRIATEVLSIARNVNAVELWSSPTGEIRSNYVVLGRYVRRRNSPGKTPQAHVLGAARIR